MDKKYAAGYRPNESKRPMIKFFVAAVLAIVLVWATYGTCDEPPRPRLEWSQSYEVRSSRKTSDGGFIMVGQFWTSGSNQYDLWVLKLNGDDSIAWQKTYGGMRWDVGFAAEETSNGGYIVVGATESFGAVDNDVWVLKLNSGGEILWQKTYGGKGEDYAASVRETKDGGYIAVGTTSSFGAGSYDIWVLKLDAGGAVQWEKTYGGKDREGGYFRHIPIGQTSDGGYIVAASTRSFGAGDDDFWILKLAQDGAVMWQKTYGTSSEEYPTSIIELPSGGYRLTGSSLLGVDEDEWILMLDVQGNMSGFRTSGKRELGVFDTTVAPKGSDEQSSPSSAVVTDTTARMTGGKKSGSANSGNPSEVEWP